MINLPLLASALQEPEIQEKLQQLVIMSGYNPESDGEVTQFMLDWVVNNLDEHLAVIARTNEIAAIDSQIQDLKAQKSALEAGE